MWRYPSQQVEHGSGFIVGSGSPAAAERLLVDDSSGRFVVDVEIAGCMCQALGQFFDVSSVVGENSSGQGIS